MNREQLSKYKKNKLVVSASVLAGILSLLTSIAGLPECNAEGE